MIFIYKKKLNEIINSVVNIKMSFISNAVDKFNKDLSDFNVNLLERINNQDKKLKYLEEELERLSKLTDDMEYSCANEIKSIKAIVSNNNLKMLNILADKKGKEKEKKKT
jgi:hypothetical protein